MALDNAWHMYIFREGKSVLRGTDLVNELMEGLADFPAHSPENYRTRLMDLLLRAGELECALADSTSPHTGLCATITDALSNSLVAETPVAGLELSRRASIIVAPEEVKVAPPEGFAYYSLHPLDFVEVVERAETHSRFAAVIGIRSIGTTLSAVVQATLRRDGVHVERTTVRPTGHPYNRETSFTSGQLQWIASMISQRADFLVVDEGPGMSGSSFLSVGDALLGAGVPRTAISFLCSRIPDAASLTSQQAAQRWPSFRSYCTRPTQFLPKGAEHYVAGGIWRADVFASEEGWPASWLQMERLKFFSKDRSTIYAFEGFGRFGACVRDRAVSIAEAGFGPMPYDREEGFGAYPMLSGKVLSSSDASPVVLCRIAEYCAFRAEQITTKMQHTPELETMLRYNAEQEFGITLPKQVSELKITKAVIADGRMLPHKWIQSNGSLLKVDSATHGDNHFFPGPTDIAWDLAGTIVEWELKPQRTQNFLDSYRHASGDDANDRLPAYLLAYSVFRMAYCKMAAASMRGSEEERRLLRDYHRYRETAERFIHDLGQRFGFDKASVKLQAALAAHERQASCQFTYRKR